MGIISTYEDKETEHECIAELEDNLEEFYSLLLTAEKIVVKLKMIGTYNRYFRKFYDRYLSKSEATYTLNDNITKGIEWQGYSVVYIPEGVTILDIRFLERISDKILVIGPGKINRILFGPENNQKNKLKNLILACNLSDLSSIGAMFSYIPTIKEIIIYGRVYGKDHTKTKRFAPDDIDYAFTACKKLKSVVFIDVDYSKMKIMSSTFTGCTSLEEIILHGTGEAHISDFRYTFSECESLRYLRLSSINTQGCRLFIGTFAKCKELKRIDLCDTFIKMKSVNTDGIFNECKSLIDINLPDWNNFMHEYKQLSTKDGG